MISTTPIPNALDALRNGARRAAWQFAQAKTDDQRQMAQFWIDYFARQIARWEAKR